MNEQKMPVDIVQRIQKELASENQILIVSHMRPDGDAVGSVLGLGITLQALGKDVQMVLPDPIPKPLRHLPGIEAIRRKAVREYSYSIVVDCSDLFRTGSVFPDEFVPDLNIDHHPTNLKFARTNLVISSAVSTTAILTVLLQALKYPISREASDALLTGLITDTIGFRTPNINAEALYLAGALVETGSNLADLYVKALVQRSFEAAKYWGMGLANLHREKQLVWTTLSLADRKAAGYPGRDDADLVNILTTIEGAKIAVIFIEQPKQMVKISWRSVPGYDISGIALRYGGGGHANAAGAELTGDLKDVQGIILEETTKLLREIQKAQTTPSITQ